MISNQINVKMEEEKTQQNNPLHGITLENILKHLVEEFGWEKLGTSIKTRSFNENPSIKSSLTFLRKTPWARSKVEEMYLWSLRRKVKKK
jgi:uncharacterized protein (DUF2132 family)